MSAPKMTRMHFQCIADTLRTLKPKDGSAATRMWVTTVYLFASDLAQTNSQFKRERFLRACGAQP